MPPRAPGAARHPDYPAVTLSDATITEYVAHANVPALLAALAFATGRSSLIPADLRPLPAVEANAAAQGGLSPAQLDAGRSLAAATLRDVRDGHLEMTATGHAPELMREVMEFLTGGVKEDYLPLLEFELGIETAPVAERELEPAPGVAPPGFRVVVIGAGLSGLVASYNLARAGIEHIVFERHADVGGVWLENTYPGCRLDTNNFTYSFSFAQKNDWMHEYSTQPEIQAYFADVANRENLRERIRFKTSVTSAQWIESESVWRLEVLGDDGAPEIVEADAIVAAVGQLNQPSYPDIPGMETFAGDSWHSSRWRHDIDLTGRRVAVVGTGASAYQLVPAIADTVEKMVVFQRSAPYMLRTPNYHEDLSAGQQWLFTHVPYYDRWFRFFVFWTAVEGRVAFSIVDEDWHHDVSISEANEELRQELVAQMQERYQRKLALRDQIVPTYPPYGKRMLRDNGVWARALELDHVSLETTGLAEVAPDAVRAGSGTTYDADVIIFATGFQARDLLGTIHVVGRDGADLRDQWKDDPRAHLGITVPNFPNLFVLYGPNTNLVVNGSQVLMIECTMHYVLESFRLLADSGMRAMECRPETLERFLDEIDVVNRQRSWGAPNVTNWYKNSLGRVTQNWPFSVLEYWHRTRRPEPDEYELTP